MAEFYKPLKLRLPDETSERHATWLELFFDLVFVVAVTQISHQLTINLTFIGVIQFLGLFVPVWWSWVGHTVYATRFDTDDTIHRIFTFIVMFGAVIMAIQVPTALSSGANGFIIGYLLAQGMILLQFVRVYFTVPEAKQMSRLYLIGFSIGTLFWCISLLMPIPYKFIFWALGMLTNFLVPWIGKPILQKAPLDTTHIPERFSQFTIIVLGETVFAVVVGLSEAHWHMYSLLTGITAFIFAILIWWLYESYMQISNYKCTLSSGQPFIYTHLPLLAGLVIAGVCIEHAIMESHAPALFGQINIIFCGAIILWLVSFMMLQHFTITQPQFEALDLYYVLAIVVLLVLFFILPLPSLIIVASLDIIFFALLFMEIRQT